MADAVEVWNGSRGQAGAAGRRVRAFRPSDADAEVRRRMAVLAVLLVQPADVRRALRDARKAARHNGPGYDPARHAALLRLLRINAGPGGMPAGGADAAGEVGNS